MHLSLRNFVLFVLFSILQTSVAQESDSTGSSIHQKRGVSCFAGYCPDFYTCCPDGGCCPMSSRCVVDIYGRGACCNRYAINGCMGMLGVTNSIYGITAELRVQQLPAGAAGAAPAPVNPIPVPDAGPLPAGPAASKLLSNLRIYGTQGIKVLGAEFSKLGISVGTELEAVWSMELAALQPTDTPATASAAATPTGANAAANTISGISAQGSYTTPTGGVGATSAPTTAGTEASSSTSTSTALPPGGPPNSCTKVQTSTLLMGALFVLGVVMAVAL